MPIGDFQLIPPARAEMAPELQAGLAGQAAKIAKR